MYASVDTTPRIGYFIGHNIGMSVVNRRLSYITVQFVHRLRITKKDLHERYNLTSLRYTFLSNERHPKWDIVGSLIVKPVSYDMNFSPTGTYPGCPTGESTLTGT